MLYVTINHFVHHLVDIAVVLVAHPVVVSFKPQNMWKTVEWSLLITQVKKLKDAER